MENLKYLELRSSFKSFFKERGHEEVSSSGLIPHGDSTLMFTNAGMNQFKNVFQGEDQRSYQRAVTIQKCLRAGGKHNDLENVGFTTRHHTFFEMMGNFSFGDYFKKEAILWAWEFLTQVLKIPSQRLCVSVFTTDDQAKDIWLRQVGLPREKIFTCGQESNFWRMGATGPCGPCSEIFYDYAPNEPGVENINDHPERFLEIWNLVFMEFFENESGSLTSLPRPCVDTGAGIERIAALVQGFRDNYQSDIFRPLVEKVCQFSKGFSPHELWTSHPKEWVATKVVVDHARATAFLLAEGVEPGGEGRNYVLRRIMRRAIRYARQLSPQESIYPRICQEVLKTMESVDPSLVEKSSLVLSVVCDEEKKFLQTLDKGSEILNEHMVSVKRKGQNRLDGDLAFKLYDTYGFPLDLTQLMAKEQGLSVDLDGFSKKMTQAQDKARSSHKSKSLGYGEKFLNEWSQKIHNQKGPTVFKGYGTLRTKGRVLALSCGEKEVDRLQGAGWVVLDSTVFYPQGGGQVADRGVLKGPNDSQGPSLIGASAPSPVKARVTDCIQKNHIHLHWVEVVSGDLFCGQELILEVNSEDRQATTVNHSATHLLHSALRELLGDTVRQSGSLVNGDKLRFDFTSKKGLSSKDIEALEQRVNRVIASNLSVTSEHMTYAQSPPPPEFWGLSFFWR